MKLEIEMIDEVFNLKIEGDEPILVPTLARACEIVVARFSHYHAEQRLVQIARGAPYFIAAIKAVRTETNWGLKEAKDFVDERIGREYYAPFGS